MEVPTCKLCGRKFESGNKPHVLPKCGHSFCANCLSQKILQSQDGSLVCPEDGQVYPHISKVDQLPLNNTIIKIIEELNDSLCPDHGKIVEYFCLTDKAR